MSRRNSVEVVDQGWDAIKDEVTKARGSSVNVGVLSDSDPHPEDGADMVLIAAANEFGTDTIPARPFIRGAFDQNQRGLQRTAQRLWDQVLAGTLTVRQALGLLGEQHQGQVQEYITALQTPANAPSTIRQKSTSAGVGNSPLEDEGRLRNSIRWEHDR